MAQDRKDNSMPKRPSWGFWGAVVAAIASIIVAVIQTVGKTDETNARVTAESRARMSEQEAAAQKENAQRTERELRELRTRQDSLQQLLVTYTTNLSEIRNAIARYKESRSPEHEKQLRDSMNRFIDFVKDWRKVPDPLVALLDGNINSLEIASSRWNLAEIESLRDRIDLNFQDKRVVMESIIKNMVSL